MIDGLAHRVIDLARDDIVWPFHGDSPYLRVGDGLHGHQIKVDPTPAYSHSLALVAATLERVSHLFPVPWPITIYLLSAEDAARTNGATYVDVDYDGPKDDAGTYTGRLATITFSAKRIPIHPALTRYLVPHEYGHVVEEWLNEQDGHKLYDETILAEYGELRGLAKAREYGAGRWHCSPGEVFANDFRAIVCGIEDEYWPHPGIVHPSELEREHPVLKWWVRRMTENQPLRAKAA